MWKKSSGFFVLCSIAAISAAQAVAQQQPQGPPWSGPWWWGDGYGWSFWWMCPVMMLVMFGVMALVMLGRRHGGDGRWAPPWHGPDHASLQILDERFARGEIHQDEYEEKKAAILSGR